MINKKLKKLFAFVCLASIFGCDDSVRTSDKYLESGNQFFAQENYVQAKLEYKNALQIDSTLIAAYYHLALIDEKDKNWQGMYNNLSQVVKLDPSHVDARFKLGQVQLLSEQFDLVAIQIDEIFKVSKDNPNAFALKGAMLLKQKDFKGALEMADKALAVEPGHVDAISLKVVVFQSKNDFPSALSVVKQALLANPNELSLNLLKLQLDIKQADSVTIETDYLDLIQRFPEKMEFNFALYKHYLNMGEQDKSLQLIQSVIKKYPVDLRPKLLLIDFFVNTDIVKAEETIKRFIAENTEAVEFYFRLARLYIQQNKLDEAKQPLNQIVAIRAEDKAGMAAKVLLAKLTLQSGDTSKAFTLVKEVLALDAGYFDAMLLKARIQLVNGLYDEAINNLRNIVKDFSASDEAMVLLAQAYLKKNAPELAEENFRKALDLNPSNFAAVMPVVSRMIGSNDIARAENILQKALEVKPDHAGALQALAQVRLLRQDWLGTQEVADVIATKPKGNGFAKYLSAKISQGQGAYQEAIDKYQLALASNPSLSDALTSMMTCYNTLNKRPSMLAYLNEFMQKNPNNPYPVVLKSEIYSMDKKWDDALAVLNIGLEKWPKVTGLYEAMAGVYVNKKQPQQVIQVYKKGLEKVPEDIRLRMLLAYAYEAEQYYSNARYHYETLIEQQPHGDVAVNNLVSLLLDHFPGKENTAKAVKLAQRFNNSEQPYFLDTYGWALLQDGKLQQALTVFEKVTTLKSDVAVFKYHLGLAYSQLNMDDKAISVLEDALALGAKDKRFVEQELTIQLLNKIKAKSGEKV